MMPMIEWTLRCPLVALETALTGGLAVVIVVRKW